MKKIIPLLLIFISCNKGGINPPSKTCGFITEKYLFNGITPYFEIGEGQARFSVSDSVYNAHKVGDWYCY